MTKKATKQATKKERPGVQVVLRVPADLKATMVRAAREAHISANQAWIVRCTTGAMPKPQPKKED